MPHGPSCFSERSTEIGVRGGVVWRNSNGLRQLLDRAVHVLQGVQRQCEVVVGIEVAGTLADGDLERTDRICWPSNRNQRRSERIVCHRVIWRSFTASV